MFRCIAQTVYDALSLPAQGTAYMLTGWKNNPNERKSTRSNRRG